MAASNHFNAVERNLKEFIRKYYVNEMMRGAILFLAFGLLYFFFTLLLEHFLWLNPFWRTILFWVFIGIECLLIFWWILVPLMKLMGLKKGLSETEASRIIGRHFSEVEDKLLNILQLRSLHEDSDLVLASIEQKSRALQPIPFKRAIVFKKNTKYARFLFIPVLVGFLFWITGNKSVLTQSLNRVVHHQTAFVPPAPFRFILLNDSIQTIENEDFVLKFKTEGELVPDEVRILYQGEVYFVERSAEGILEHTILSPERDVEFILAGNDHFSPTYTLEVLVAPKITDFSMIVKYPEYLGKEDQIISNTGNAQVPEGSEITWEVGVKNTDRLDYKFSLGRQGSQTETKRMEKVDDELFTWDMLMKNSLQYSITSSNAVLNDYETLQYKIDVVPDAYPGIRVYQEEDHESVGYLHFVGTVTDDHGISRLQVVAKNTENGTQSIKSISVGRSDFEEFFYRFPEGLVLEEGQSYEVYFEVYDNDGINGAKRSVSGSFHYRSMTDKELQQEMLEDQQNSMDAMEKQRQENQEVNKNLERLNEQLKTKNEADWKDRKKVEEYLERQDSYQEMMKKSADKMKRNLEQEEEDDPELKRKREALIDRWEEIMDVENKDELLEELEKMAELLEKDELIEKMEELQEHDRQEQRSLERILELTRQFYVEKKSSRIKKLLEELAEKQERLSEDGNNSSQQQEGLNKEFEAIQKEFEELREQNESLKKKVPLYDSESDEKLINMEMQEAKSGLEQYEREQGEQKQQEGQKAQQKQKSASRRMKELSSKMQAAMMQMQMQNNQANIEDLEQILKNLVIFSYDQENLMLSMEQITDKSSEFSGKLKEQIKLKEHFEHIDDSLYVLSMKLVDLSVNLEKDLASVHYNLNRSLDNLAENRIEQGRSNQHYTMTSANEIANLLSDLLQSMQNQSPGSGQGQGKEELSLPDIIKKQHELMEKAGQGQKQKSQQGQQGKEELSREQFQLYQEQRALREKLEELIKKQGGLQGEDAVRDQMEELEKLMLEKGISQETVERMKQLEHELLELEDAALKRNKDLKREAKTAMDAPQMQGGDSDYEMPGTSTREEQIRRKSLKLNEDYQRRVRRYFEKQSE